MAVAQPVAKFGKYELVKRIGQGGMAEVFLSRTRSIGGFERLLVIKRLLPQYASDANIVRLFLDEARIAARLHHANIVQVHDVDAADGAVFYAMEYLRGHDLREIVHALGQVERGFPLDQAIAIALAVCAGLHHAHQLTGADGELLQLVHRDVSPHNIVVLFDGSVKIIDFGIAKVRGTRADTQAGLVRGKYSYMSPEQALGQPLDGRSDVFATSIVLYELATGRRLFDINEHDALRAIVYTDAPSPSKAREDFPPELEKILARGLARDRAVRYPTALAMQHDLEAFARSQDLDVSASSLGRFMSALFRDEAAEITRPVLETLRDDTGLWALGPDAELASLTATTRKVGGSETATLTKTAGRRRRAIALALASVALTAGAIFAWRWQSGDTSSPAAPPPVIASPAAAIVMPLDAAVPVEQTPTTPMAIETPPSPSHPLHKPRRDAKPLPPPPPPALIVRPPLKDPDSLLPRYTTPRDAGT